MKINIRKFAALFVVTSLLLSSYGKSFCAFAESLTEAEASAQTYEDDFAKETGGSETPEKTKEVVQTTTEAQTQAQSEAQTQAQSEAQTQAQSEAQTQAQSEAQTQAQSEAQTQAQSEAQTQAQSEAQTQAQSEAQTQESHQTTATESQTELQTQEQAETLAQNQTEPGRDGDSSSGETEETEELLRTFSSKVGKAVVSVTLPKGSELPESAELKVTVTKASEDSGNLSKAKSLLQKIQRVVTGGRFYHLSILSGDDILDIPSGTKIEYSRDDGLSLKLEPYSQASFVLLNLSSGKGSLINGASLSLSTDGLSLKKASFKADGDITVFAIVGTQNIENNGEAILQSDLWESLEDDAYYAIIAQTYEGNLNYMVKTNSAGEEESEDSGEETGEEEIAGEETGEEETAGEETGEEETAGEETGEEETAGEETGDEETSTEESGTEEEAAVAGESENSSKADNEGMANSSDIEGSESASAQADDVSKTMSADVSKADESEDMTISDMLDFLSEYSVTLGNATSGDDTVVVNVYAGEDGSLLTDSSDTQDPVKKVLTYDGRIDVTGRTVIINIVSQSVYTQQIFLPAWGAACADSGVVENVSGEENSQYASRIIYNIIAISSGTDGSYSLAPYTGSITVTNDAVGTFIAPCAYVEFTQSLTGAVYADSVTTTGAVTPVTVTAEADDEDESVEQSEEANVPTETETSTREMTETETGEMAETETGEMTETETGEMAEARIESSIGGISAAGAVVEAVAEAIAADENSVDSELGQGSEETIVQDATESEEQDASTEEIVSLYSIASASGTPTTEEDYAKGGLSDGKVLVIKVSKGSSTSTDVAGAGLELYNTAQIDFTYTESTTDSAEEAETETFKVSIPANTLLDSWTTEKGVSHDISKWIKISSGAAGSYVIKEVSAAPAVDDTETTDDTTDTIEYSSAWDFNFSTSSDGSEVTYTVAGASSYSDNSLDESDDGSCTIKMVDAAIADTDTDEASSLFVNVSVVDSSVTSETEYIEEVPMTVTRTAIYTASSDGTVSDTPTDSTQTVMGEFVSIDGGATIDLTPFESVLTNSTYPSGSYEVLSIAETSTKAGYAYDGDSSVSLKITKIIKTVASNGTSTSETKYTVESISTDSDVVSDKSSVNSSGETIHHYSLVYKQTPLTFTVDSKVYGLSSSSHVTGCTFELRNASGTALTLGTDYTVTLSDGTTDASSYVNGNTVTMPSEALIFSLVPSSAQCEALMDDGILIHKVSSPSRYDYYSSSDIGVSFSYDSDATSSYEYDLYLVYALTFTVDAQIQGEGTHVEGDTFQVLNSSGNNLTLGTDYTVALEDGTDASGYVLSDGTITMPSSALVFTLLASSSQYSSLVASGILLRKVDSASGYTYVDTNDVSVTFTSSTGENGTVITASATPFVLYNQLDYTNSKNQGLIRIRKRVLRPDGTTNNPVTSKQTYYVALFSSASGGTLLAGPKSITITKGNSISTVKKSALFEGLDPDVTYYALETDKKGNIISTPNESIGAITYLTSSVSTKPIGITPTVESVTNSDGTYSWRGVVTTETIRNTMTSIFMNSGTFTIKVNVYDGYGNKLSADIVATFKVHNDIDGLSLGTDPTVTLSNVSSASKSDIYMPFTGTSTTMTVTLQSITSSDGTDLSSVYTVDEKAKTFTLKADDDNATTLVFTLTRNDKPVAELSLTKAVNYKNTPIRVNATYYIGIFSDADHSTLLYNKAMSLEDASSLTSTLQINLYKLAYPYTITFYFAEVDKNGKEVKSGKSTGYDISLSTESVTLSPTSSTGTVVVTNSILDGSVAAARLTDDSSGFAGDASALAEAQALAELNETGKETGDNSQLDTYRVTVIVSGAVLLFMAGIFVIKKRKRGTCGKRRHR